MEQTTFIDGEEEKRRQQNKRFKADGQRRGVQIGELEESRGEGVLIEWGSRISRRMLQRLLPQTADPEGRGSILLH